MKVNSKNDLRNFSKEKISKSLGERKAESLRCSSITSQMITPTSPTFKKLSVRNFKQNFTLTKFSRGLSI